MGVERVFQSFSPAIDSVEVKRRGSVRRAKLYYMRDLSGRAARIKEKLSARIDVAAVAPDAPSSEESTANKIANRNILLACSCIAGEVSI